MKRRNIIITLLLAVGLMIIPQLGTAGMTPLTEEQLNTVVGQASLSVQTDKLTHTAKDNLSYGDSDALGLGNGMNASNMSLSGLGIGVGATAGYIGLSSVCVKESAQFATSLVVGIATAGIGLGLFGFAGMGLGLTGATILDSQSGNGKSPLSIYVSNMTTSITGKVQISPR